MTRNIIFKGRMGQLFGEVHRLNVKTLQEGLWAIDTMKGGLRKYLIDCTENGIYMTVQRGEEFLTLEELELELGAEDIIITPVPAGAGIKKFLAGLAFIALAIFMPEVALTIGEMTLNVNAVLFTIGLNLALNGIIEMTMDDPDELDEQKSQMFNGPINNTKSGIPVPLCYGKMEVGGAVVNFGFTNSRLTSQTGYKFVSKGSVSGSGVGGVFAGDNNYDWGAAGGAEEEDATTEAE